MCVLLGFALFLLTLQSDHWSSLVLRANTGLSYWLFSRYLYWKDTETLFDGWYLLISAV